MVGLRKHQVTQRLADGIHYMNVTNLLYAFHSLINQQYSPSWSVMFTRHFFKQEGVIERLEQPVTFFEWIAM